MTGGERREGDDMRDSFINSTERDVVDQGGTSNGGNQTDARDRSK